MSQPAAILKVKTIFSQLSPLDADYPGFVEVWSYLDAFLSYEIHNSFFIKAMSNKEFVRDQWDGRNHLFSVKTGKFLTGLLPYVKEALQQYNIPYTIEDDRMEYVKQSISGLILESRPYQENAVDMAYTLKRGILWMRPRSGKTIVEIMLVQRLGLMPALSICQNIDIARQTIAKFNQFLPKVKVGLIGDGECDIQPITVATIQSLSAAYDIKEKIPKKQMEKIPALAKKLDIQHMVETAKFVWVDECFPKGVKVLTAVDSYMSIEKIVENPQVTQVLSYDLKTHQIVQKRILRKIKVQKSRKLMHIEIDVDGQIKTLNCTRNHKIWTTNGYAAAEDLTVGDEVKYFGTFDNAQKIFVCPECGLAGYNGQRIGIHRQVHTARVVKVRKFREAATVYNLEIEDTHNYFANGILVSNCHHATSSTHKYILQNKIYSAEYILGCSGTPYREDNTNMLLEGLLGPIIYEIDYSKLIDTGYLVRPTIHLVKIPKIIQFGSNASYPSIYSQAVVENGLRNGTIARIAHSLKDRGKTCMILVNKINHGKILAKLIPCAKFSYSKSKDRASLWHQLKVGKLSVLITTLGDEGIDIPSLGATIIASGGESAIKVFQRLRCLTPHGEKHHAIVVDFMDPYKYLSRHSKKREKLYRSEPSFRITYKEVKV